MVVLHSSLDRGTSALQQVSATSHLLNNLCRLLARPLNVPQDSLDQVKVDAPCDGHSQVLQRSAQQDYRYSRSPNPLEVASPGHCWARISCHSGCYELPCFEKIHAATA